MTSQDNQGTDTERDDLLVRVHAFLSVLLTFLGFATTTTDNVDNMLDTLTQWLADAKAIRRDPQGATARIWWEAFKLARGFDPVTKRAAESADEYTAEFGKRFLPVAEDERKTLNEGDIAALRAALDEETEKVDALRSERDVLRRANEHHADEIVQLTTERDALLTINENQASAIETMQRHKTQQLADIDTAIANACGWPKSVTFNRIEAIRVLGKECDELKRASAGAIVPLPKPERVEPGQRWAFVASAGAVTRREQWCPRRWAIRCHYGDVHFETPDDLDVKNESMIYLGTEAQ